MPLLPPQTDDELVEEVEEPVETKYKRLLDSTPLPPPVKDTLYKTLIKGRGNPYLIKRMMQENADEATAPIFSQIWRLRYPMPEPEPVDPTIAAHEILKQRHAVNVARGQEAEARGIFNTPDPPTKLQPVAPTQPKKDVPSPQMFDSWKTYWEAQTGKLPDNYDLKGMYEAKAKPAYNQLNGAWTWPKDFEFASGPDQAAQPQFAPPQPDTKKEPFAQPQLTPPQDIGTFGRDLNLQAAAAAQDVTFPNVTPEYLKTHQNEYGTSVADYNLYRQNIESRMKGLKAKVDAMPAGSQARYALGEVYNKQLATFKTELEKKERAIANLRSYQPEASEPVLGQDKFKSSALPEDKTRIAGEAQRQRQIDSLVAQRDAAIAEAAASGSPHNAAEIGRLEKELSALQTPGISQRPSYSDFVDIFKPHAIQEGIRQFVNQDPRDAAMKYLPYGSVLQISEGAQVLAAANRIAADQGTAEDESLVKDWQRRAEQDPNVVFSTLNTIASMPGFATEIMTSGGLYGAAKTKILTTMQKAVGAAIKKMSGKVIGDITGTMTARTIAGIVATEVIPAVSTRAIAETVELVRPTIEQGKVTEQGESLPSALYKSFFNQIVEFASERSGDLPKEIAQGTGKWIISKLPQLQPLAAKLESGIAKILKTNGNTDLIDEMLRRMGYNGFLGEMAEERIGEVARYIVGVDDKYQVPTADQLAQEALAFGVIPLGSAILRKFKVGERKPPSTSASEMERRNVIEPQPFDPSTLGGEELAAALREEFGELDAIKAKRAEAKPVDVGGAVAQWTMVNSALNDVLGTINQRGAAGGEEDRPVLTNLERATPEEREQVKHIVGIRQQARLELASAIPVAGEEQIPWLETLAQSAAPELSPFKSLAQVRLQQLTGSSTLHEADQPEVLPTGDAPGIVPHAPVETTPQRSPIEAIRTWMASKLAAGAEAISPGYTTQDVFGAQTAVGDRRAMERATTTDRRQPNTRLVRFRMDLDNFKALNDELGHPKGDEALKLVTETLQSKGRPGDQAWKLPSRPGGDEFAMIMEVSDKADISKIAQDYETAIATALEQKGLRNLPSGMEVGASMAGAQWQPGMSVEAWDDAADKAAIARKSARRVSQKRQATVDVQEVQTGIPKPTIEVPIEGTKMRGRILDTITYDVIMRDGDTRPGTVSIQVQRGWTDEQIIAEAQRQIEVARQNFGKRPAVAEPVKPTEVPEPAEPVEKTWMGPTPDERAGALVLPPGVSVEFRFMQEGFEDVPATEAFDINIEGGPQNITIQLAPGEDLQQRVMDKLEEFKPKEPPKPSTLDVDQLPDYAKSAIFYMELGRITNSGGQTPSNVNQVLRDYAPTWELATVPIESLRKGNEVLFEKASTFQPRGSMTTGPIVLGHSGEVIDGNNRVYEALQRGETDIQVYRPVAKPTKEPGRYILAKQIEDFAGLTAAEAAVLIEASKNNKLGGIEGIQKAALALGIKNNLDVSKIADIKTIKSIVEKFPELLPSGEEKPPKLLHKNLEAALKMALAFAKKGKKELMDEFIDDAKVYGDIPVERLEEIYAALPQKEPKVKPPKTLTPPPQQDIFETGHYVVTKDDVTNTWTLRHKDTRESIGVPPFLTAEEGINQANALELLRHGRSAKFGDIPKQPDPPKLDPPIDIPGPALDATRKAELQRENEESLRRMKERKKGRLGQAAFREIAEDLTQIVQSEEDSAESVRIIYRPGDLYEPDTIFAGPSFSDFLANVLVPDLDTKLNGVTFSSADRTDLATRSPVFWLHQQGIYLRLLANSVKSEIRLGFLQGAIDLGDEEFQKAWDVANNKLLRALNDAAIDFQQILRVSTKPFILVNLDPGMSQAILSLRHELAHARQMAIAAAAGISLYSIVDREKFLDHELIVNISETKTVLHTAYSRAELPVEIAARIAAGEHEKLGLTDREAATLYGYFFELALERHGDRAFTLLGDLTPILEDLIHETVEPKIEEFRKRPSEDVSRMAERREREVVRGTEETLERPQFAFSEEDLTPEIDDEDLIDSVKISANFLEMGYLSFKAWSRQMVDFIGNEIEPFLEVIYNRTLKKNSKFAEAARQANERERLEADGPDQLAGDKPEKLPGGGEGREPGSDPGLGGRGLSGPDDESQRGEPRDVGGPSKVDRPATDDIPGGGIIRPPRRNERFHRITSPETLGFGTPKELFKKNIEAINHFLEVTAKMRELGRDREAPYIPTAEDRQIVAGFVGWGAIPQVFGGYGVGWDKEYDQLRSLLTDAQYKAAYFSTLNAHYTSGPIVQAMWRMARKLGFSGGSILEPAYGIGNFVGLAPQAIIDNSQFYGVEMDDLTAKMAQFIYPEAIISNLPFQELAVENASKDIIITNVPFGDMNVADTRYDLNFTTIHDYYFVRSLDILKPGGLMVAITSTGTLDKQNSTFRNHIGTRADLVAAYRLPNNAFEKNAGTKVTTDILIFRKRFPGEERGGADFSLTTPWGAYDEKMQPIWAKTKDKDENEVFVKDKNGANVQDTIPVNEYFEKHPDHMFGTLVIGQGLHGRPDKTLQPRANSNIELFFDDMIEKLPANIFGADPRLVQDEKFGNQRRARVRVGSIKIKEGQLHVTDRTGDLRPLTFDDFTIPKSYVGKDGKRRSIGDNEAAKAEYVSKQLDGINRLKALVELRDMALELRNKQVETDDDQLIKVMQNQLNNLYDAYIDRFDPAPEGQRTTPGGLHSDETWRVFRNDPDYPFMLALEDHNPETLENKKAAIFYRRIAYPSLKMDALSDNAQEALLQVMAERGRPDLDHMARLWNKPVHEVVQTLIDANLIYKDPGSGLYETSEQYLSGFLRTKLKLAEQFAKDFPQYQRNILALQKAIADNIPSIPMDVVYAKPGATWIPNDVYKQFFHHIFRWQDWKGNSGITIQSVHGNWIVDMGKTDNSVENRSEYGATQVDSKFTAGYLFKLLLNQQIATVPPRSPGPNSNAEAEKAKANQATAVVRAKQKELLNAFIDYARTGPHRDRMETEYNYHFNNVRLREYDGSHLALPGMDPEIAKKFYPHQRNTIWRLMQEGRGLVAHAVGAGKTFTLIGAAMELKRIGAARKSLFVVPNHLVRYWAGEINKLYPNAKVLAARQEDFTGETEEEVAEKKAKAKEAPPDAKQEKAISLKRKLLFEQIGTGDHDIVVLSHSSYGYLPIDPRHEQLLIQDQIDQVFDALRGSEGQKSKGKKGSRHVKQLAKSMQKLQEKMQKLVEQAKNRTDDTITFDQMGFDHLFVDESHAFKNMPFYTKMGSISGLSSSDAQRATNMMVKARYMQQKRGGRGVIFATATPITRTLAEIYINTRYIAPDLLTAAGIRYFDDWAANFGEVIEVKEMGVSGKFKVRTKFSKFLNVPELSTMFRTFTDVKLPDEINLEVPEIEGGKPRFIEVEPTHQVEELFKEIEVRVAALEKGNVDPKVDNWFKVSVDGRKLAIDPRMMKARAEDDPGSSVNATVKVILDEYKRYEDVKGTQIVFCELYRLVKRPNADDVKRAKELNLKPPKDELLFHLWEDMKTKLVEGGVKPSEIVDMGTIEGDEAKEDVFRRMRAGDIRVLFGTTAKMGTGTNVQTRLVNLVHMDPTWNPADMEQRTGRIMRPGNKVGELLAELGKAFPGVNVTFMLPVKTFAGYMYQNIQSKQIFIKQIMSGRYKDRTVIDAAGDTLLNAGAAKAILSGNPLIEIYEKKKQDLNDLRIEQQGFYSTLARLKEQLRNMEYSVNYDKKEKAKYEKIRAIFNAATNDGENFVGVIDGHLFTNRDEAVKYFDEPSRIRQSLYLYGHDLNFDQPESWISEHSQDHELYKGHPGYKEKEGFAAPRLHASYAHGAHQFFPYLTELHVTAAGDLFTNIRRWLGLIPSRLQEINARIDRGEEDIAKTIPLTDRKWNKGAEITALEQEIKDIEVQLKIREAASTDDQPPDVTPDTPDAEEEGGPDEDIEDDGEPDGYSAISPRFSMVGEEREPEPEPTAAAQTYQPDFGVPDVEGQLAAPLEEQPEEQEGEYYSDEELTQQAALTEPTEERLKIAPIEGGGTPMKYREMLNSLASDIDNYIAVAKLPSKVGGEYVPTNAAIRIRNAGLIDVAIHEVAHFLDDQFGIVKLWADSRRRSPFDSELLGNFARYGSVTKTGPRSALWYQRAEGVAEWVRAWAFNPDGAARLAPKFFDYVVNNKPPKGVPPLNLDPKVLASIRRYGDRVRAWAGMSRRNMALANVRMFPEQKNVYQQVKDFYEGNNLNFNTTFWDRYVRSAVADRFQPFHKAVEFLKGMRNDIESILPGNDPSILLGAYSGFSQKAAVVITNGMINSKGELAPGIEGGIRWLAGENPDGSVLLDTSSEPAYKEDFVDTVMYGLFTRVAYRGDKIFEKAQNQIDAISYAMQLSTGMTPQEVEQDDGFQKRSKAILNAAEQKAGYLAGFTGGTQSDYRFAKKAIREMELTQPEKVSTWKEMFRRYNLWADAVLRYWVDKGRLSEDAYNYIKDNNEQYYAMNRIITDGYAGADEPNVGRLDPSTTVGFSRKLGFANQPLQVMRGSLQEIQNPYESLIYQTFAFMREADRNEILDKFTNLLKNNLRTKMYEGIQMQLANVGQEATSRDRDSVLVYKDGKETNWRFPDKGLYQAIDNWGKIGGFNQVAGIIGVVTAKVPRWLITHGPGFVYRSFIREPLQRGIISRVGSKPQDALHGYTDEELDAYMMAGGSQKPWNVGDSQTIQKEFSDAMKSMVEDGSIKVIKTKSGAVRVRMPQTGKDYLMMPYQGMKKAFRSYGDFVQEFGEVRSRMAEFKAAFKYAKDNFPNWSDYDASLWAAHEARDLLDYYRVGWFMEPIVKIIPFLNSSIQGKLRTMRGVVEEFKVAKKMIEEGNIKGGIGEIVSGFMPRFMTYVVLPRLLFYAYTSFMGDDDEYRKLPPWRRLFFLNIKPGIPGTDIKLPFWVVIPTPFELGFLGAGVELAIEAWRGENPEAWNEFVDGTIKSLMPVDDFIPSGPVRGIEEGRSNYSFWFDRYIVPPWEEDKHFDLRDPNRGSTIGRGLESLTRAFHFGAEEQGYGVDARKIDNFISNVSGSLGYFINALTDVAAGKQDTRTGSRVLSSLGVITESPSGSSTDVQWVMRISKALGDGNSREMRQLGDLLKFQREGGTMGERSDRAQAVRAYAAQLKGYYSALYNDILKLKTVANTLADDDKWGHEKLRLAEQELAVLRRQTSISVNPVERQGIIQRMKEVVQFATQPSLIPPEMGEYKRMMDLYANYTSDGLNDKMQRLEDLMIYAELHQASGIDFQQFVNSPSVQAIVNEGGPKPDLNDLIGKLANRKTSDRYMLRMFMAERSLPTTAPERKAELSNMIQAMRWQSKEHQLEQQMR